MLEETLVIQLMHYLGGIIHGILVVLLRLPQLLQLHQLLLDLGGTCCLLELLLSDLGFRATAGGAGLERHGTVALHDYSVNR